MTIREHDSPIWEIWQAGGPFVGDKAVAGAVTVEKDYWLKDSFHLNSTANHLGTWGRGPARGFAYSDGDQTELVVPGVQTVQRRADIAADAKTCTVMITNTVMSPSSRTEILGEPGALSPERGGTRLRPFRTNRSRLSQPPPNLAYERWGHTHNEWYGQLVEGALIRTYGGYWPRNPTTIEDLQDAVAARRMAVSGTWIVDVMDDSWPGAIRLECRDLMQYLLDQALRPPLVPAHLHPLRYVRWVNETKTTTSAAFNPRRLRYVSSSGDMWYPGSVVAGKGARIHGHYPADALDSNASTYWLSVGNSHGSKPFAYDWIEVDAGGVDINQIRINPKGGGYEVFVSIKENGVWQGTNTIPYDHEPLIGNQPYVVNTGADIKYVHRTGTGGASNWNAASSMIINLPRSYKAQRIRITMHEHAKTQWGPWYYRCGIQTLQAGVRGTGLTTVSATRKTGNYSDYSDIVEELLLWGGFWLLPPAVDGHYSVMNYPQPDKRPRVFGLIESTSAYADEPLPSDMFDGVTIHDAITKLKQIVGYIFFIKGDGSVHFASPNFWAAGNRDEYGRHVNMIPVLDERHNVTDYTVKRTKRHARTSITVATAEPLLGIPGTKQVTHYPPNRTSLRGMQVPAVWINGSFVKDSEMRRMAEQISLQTWLASRAGTVQCPDNPLFDLDMQIRIWEETTGEVYIHWLRGFDATHDFRKRKATATLNTNWLGRSTEDWVIRKGDVAPMPRRTYIVPDDHETWARMMNRIRGRANASTFSTTLTEGLVRAMNAQALQESGGLLLKGMEIVY